MKSVVSFDISFILTLSVVFIEQRCCVCGFFYLFYSCGRPVGKHWTKAMVDKHFCITFYWKSIFLLPSRQRTFTHRIWIRNGSEIFAWLIYFLCVEYVCWNLETIVRRGSSCCMPWNCIDILFQLPSKWQMLYLHLFDDVGPTKAIY